ncbi:SEL1-like repeat protein [Undibacterium sp. LX40W]|uniref:SEL1-like repeat protein n=1 Tax=Undibacterium nitidum TaxID=2762298 RepID=A0A923HNR8_9BURK|nr:MULTISPECIES: SEL1-like repeat protein [Undibacterium]MBC3880475.1 SEL1-like repeat protein [Undibacterium nitidum]MBC3890789.1 SEL1-like repeat protein [Undibacterium sp. LX40W]
MGLIRFLTPVIIVAALILSPASDAATAKKAVPTKAKAKSAPKKNDKANTKVKHGSKAHDRKKESRHTKTSAKGKKAQLKSERAEARAAVSAHDLALAPEAQFQQAMSYTRTGKRKKPDWAHAIPLLEKSATTYPLAQYRLADYYLGNWGKGHRVNPELGYEYLAKASNAGYLQAQVEYARYLEKKGEHQSALKLWREAADQGHVDAMLRFVELNDVKKHPNADPVMAYAYIQIAGQQIMAKRAALTVKTEREQKAEEAFQVYVDKMASALNDEQKIAANSFVAEWQARPTEITQHVDKLPKK